MKVNITQRQFLKGAMMAGGASALAGLYAWQVEPFWLEFVRRPMPIRNLPQNLENVTLMQISDMHVGNYFDRQFLIDSMQEAQALNPDIVVYTGDFVTYESSKQLKQLQEVMQHSVTGRLGSFGVLGNHDYGTNLRDVAVADQIIQILGESGVRILQNASTEVAGLQLIGIDDFWSINFKPQLAFQGYDDTKAGLVLCHNPDVVDLDVWHGYQGWILSGHTHGGQCKVPFMTPPILPVRNKAYHAGEVDLGDGRMLYINRALGHSIQVRFNVRPEITVFELLKA